ncbi:hypothetical protein LOZ80_15010 [Paenibacillus sp. HWE-109]|uniref:hypothetical protein n=1 Tax=Paenibacillus sp. HWE-109 TaxID=1306526 RepID=UPI001EDD3938|nr:hypothetical protein [Paenibacillus sp. HWE-109]UKS30171.1 hypothetical protein LOZ80_15010 [Paenibacillus sp. HWE-109]
MLKTDIELFAAALSQACVVVSTDGKREDAGIIRGFCENYVRIANTWFARSLYEFRVLT